MHETLEFIIRHGYWFLFLLVLVEQLGLPVPSFPLLLAAGALGASGKLSLGISLSLVVFAALLSDGTWFAVARHRGDTVLHWICRISLEPDSCVRRTKDIYVKHGSRSLLVAKFLPGLNAVAAPLAGIFRMRLWRFLLFDAAGIFLWAGCYIGLGVVFSSQLEDVAMYLSRLGQFLGFLLVAALCAYIGRKYYRRKQFMRELRIARISPEELKRMIDAGEPVQIVDLRHSPDFAAEPRTLPGAMHFDPQEIDRHLPQIAMDRDVILYCT